MNMDAIQRLLGILPDGPKKESLIQKYQAMQPKGGRGGLNDIFEFKTKGHIMIEEIDASGSVVGVLADQPNLVVKGAEEILLRAFSGDPERVLYKNRVPKAASGISPKYHVGLTEISRVVDGVNQLSFAPNAYWKAAKDEDFTIAYSYRPLILYLKEETSDEVGKKAFTISKTSVSGAIAICSEIYSSSTNLFIGLGDGLNAPVSLSDSRLTYTANWISSEGKRTAKDVGETITLKEKMSNFAVEYDKSSTGGQIEVSIDGVAQTLIETLDSDLEEPVKASKLYEGLNGEVEHEIIIKFAAFDPSLDEEEANIVIAGIRTDGLTKDMNGLMREFDNNTYKFDTTMVYNTTNIAPFYTQLNHFPVVKNSLVVEYNGARLEQVATKEELAEGKYFVDDINGQLFFNRTLSGLLVTYNITGENHFVKTASSIAAGTNATVAVVKELLTPDGTKTVFTLANKGLVAGSAVVKVDDVEQVSGVSFDNANGKVTFTTAPAADDIVEVSYSYANATKKFVSAVAIRGAKVINRETGVAYTAVTEANKLAKGTFMIDEADNKNLIISSADATGTSVINFIIVIDSAELKGFPTGYTRQVIEKPKAGVSYPWYSLDKGSVTFVTEFAEKTPNYNVTIREMGLFDGPRDNDKVDGFSGYPVDAFSLVRVGATRKEVTTGIRVTWTITLLNKDGDPFYGGF